MLSIQRAGAYHIRNSGIREDLSKAVPYEQKDIHNIVCHHQTQISQNFGSKFRTRIIHCRNTPSTLLSKYLERENSDNHLDVLNHISSQLVNKSLEFSDIDKAWKKLKHKIIAQDESSSINLSHEKALRLSEDMKKELGDKWLYLCMSYVDEISSLKDTQSYHLDMRILINLMHYCKWDIDEVPQLSQYSTLDRYIRKTQAYFIKPSPHLHWEYLPLQVRYKNTSSLQLANQLFYEERYCEEASFMKLFKNLTTSKEVLLEAIKEDDKATQYIPDAFVDDTEFLQKVIKKNPWNIGYFSPALLQNKEIIKFAIKLDPLVVNLLPSQIQMQLEFPLLAIQQDHRVFKYLFSSLQYDISFIRKAVALNGLILGNTIAIWKNNREIALAAIENNAEAFIFVSEHLKEDKDFILAAVTCNPFVWEKLSQQWQMDQDVQAIMHNFAAILREANLL